MKKQYLLLILLLILPIFISAKTDIIEYFNNKTESISEMNGPIYNYFYKQDEDGNKIEDAEFIIRDLNKKIKYDVIFDNNYKAYKYLQFNNYEYQNLVSALPSSVKNIVFNFKKMEDFTPHINPIILDSTINNFEDMYVDCDRYDDMQKSSDIETEYPIKKMESVNKYYSCYVLVPTVMFLEETKTPKGYEKETAVLPATIYFQYEFNLETESISKIESKLNYSVNNYRDDEANWIRFQKLYKFDENLNYDDIESAYNAFANYDEKMIYESTICTMAYASNMNGDIKKYNLSKVNNEFELEELLCTPIIVDKKGNSALTVNSYVNSKEEVNLTESSNVEIKVFLKNSGKAPSYENKVVSNVPEGVEYVAGSATDNGVYDEEKNTVTWDLDYLDASSGYIFSYEVAVTTGSKESVYVTTSSVSSDDNETPIVSNEAKVTTPGVGGDAPEEESEEIINPKTGVSYPIMLMLVLLLGSALTLIFTSKKKIDLN